MHTHATSHLIVVTKRSLGDTGERACCLLAYERIPICCQIEKVPYSKVSEE